MWNACSATWWCLYLHMREHMAVCNSVGTSQSSSDQVCCTGIRRMLKINGMNEQSQVLIEEKFPSGCTFKLLVIKDGVG